MKLASLNNQTRDGQLIVVNKSLSQAIVVPEIASSLQEVLDNWAQIKPQLEEISADLNKGKLKTAFPLEPKKLMAPLPRAYQWLDASAYVSHVELVRKSRGVEMPANFWTEPLMYQGASDHLLGCRDPIAFPEISWGIDFEAEIAIMTDDVPMGVTPTQAKDHIQLFMLLNDISLRNLAMEELKKGFGFINAKPATAFSAVAVTADELGDAWDGARLHLPLLSYLNEELFGWPNAGTDMTFGFPELIAHAAKTRHLKTGTIIGSGTVSNACHAKGSSCIVEKRMLEQIQSGSPKTPFMKIGDTIRIEMKDQEGNSIFGDIQQKVENFESSATIHHEQAQAL